MAKIKFDDQPAIFELPDADTIKAVDIHYDTHKNLFYGLTFFTKFDTMFQAPLKVAKTPTADRSEPAVQRVVINDGDRIVGITSELAVPGEHAVCFDF